MSFRIIQGLNLSKLGTWTGFMYLFSIFKTVVGPQLSAGSISVHLLTHSSTLLANS